MELKPSHACPPGYKQTEMGVIPEDWEVKQVGDFRPFVTSGSRGWAVFYSERGDVFVRITNLSRSTIYLDLADVRFVRVLANDTEAHRTQVKDGDILISITADIGIIGYVSGKVPKPAYISQHIALVRFNQSQIEPKFISYFLASAIPQKRFRALTDSGAKAGMNLVTVQQILLALPPHARRTASHRRGPERRRRPRRGPGAAHRQEAPGQAGDDAGVAHREEAVAGV